MTTIQICPPGWQCVGSSCVLQLDGRQISFPHPTTPIGAIKVACTWVISDADNSDKIIAAFFSGLSSIQNNIIGNIGNVQRQERDNTAKTINSVNAARNTVNSNVNNRASEIRASIQAAVSQIISSSSQTTEGITNNINEVTRGVGARLETRIVSENTANRSLLDGIKLTAAQTALNVITGFNDTIDTVKASAQGVVDDVTETVKTTIDSVSVFLADKVAELIETIKSIFTPFIEFLSNLLEQAKETWATLVAPISGEALSKSRLVSSFLKAVEEGDIESFDQIDELMDEIMEGTGMISVAILFMVVGGAISTIMQAVITPFAARLMHRSSNKARPDLIPIGDLLRANYRGILSEDEEKDELGWTGLDNWRFLRLLEANRPLLSIFQITSGWLRDFLSDDQAEEKLKNYGFEAEDREVILKLTDFLIPPQDLIRMAVREVFTPDIAEDFGQFEEFPDEVMIRAKMLGISRDTMEKYWAAHWRLPSPTMGFEMRHRSIITTERLEKLLKALDFMPGWRDEVIALSFRVVTRVDTRRLFKISEWDRTQVKDNYLKLGYDEVSAEAMTKFTEIAYAPELDEDGLNLRELSRTLIEKGFLAGKIERAPAIAALRKLRYTIEDAEFILDMVLHNAQSTLIEDLSKTHEKRLITLTITMYKRRSISEIEVMEIFIGLGFTFQQAQSEIDFADLESEMLFKDEVIDNVRDIYFRNLQTKQQLEPLFSNAGFNNGEINRIFTEMDVIKGLRSRLPTPTQLLKLLKDDSISQEVFDALIAGSGYPELSAKLLQLL